MRKYVRFFRIFVLQKYFRVPAVLWAQIWRNDMPFRVLHNIQSYFLEIMMVVQWLIRQNYQYFTLHVYWIVSSIHPSLQYHWHKAIILSYWRRSSSTSSRDWKTLRTRFTSIARFSISGPPSTEFCRNISTITINGKLTTLLTSLTSLWVHYITTTSE